MKLCDISSEAAFAERKYVLELVTTPQQAREVFRLRHQVYCIERQFETVEGGEESDEFDSRCRHVLLRHADDHEPVGTVRLVAHDPQDLSASFPIQRLCEPALLRHLPLHTTGEISRFAISKQRRGGGASLLRLELMRGLVRLSGEMGLTHWLAVMDPSLQRLLKRTAIHFDDVGAPVSYHGTRQPVGGAIVSVLGRIRREQLAIWNFLTDRGAWCSQPDTFAAAA